MCMKTGRISFPLKAPETPVTLTGGTEGHTDDAKHPPSSASSAAPEGFLMTRKQASLSRAAHHALSAMIAGYIDNDRRLLDDGFEDLVGLCEEMRDAVPKIQAK